MVSLGRELSVQNSQQKHKISALNVSKGKGTGIKILDVSLIYLFLILNFSIRSLGAARLW